MSQKQAQVELESVKVQAVVRESTDRPTLHPNSSFTLYLTIFYLQRIAPNVEDYSSLDCYLDLNGDEMPP